MQLNDLKPAWRQMKLLHAMPLMEAEEILSIIERPEKVNNTGLQKAFFGLVMLVVTTLFCQGG